MNWDIPLRPRTISREPRHAQKRPAPDLEPGLNLEGLRFALRASNRKGD